MCSPCGPMVCYKYEDCGPAKGKSSDGAHKAEEGGVEKKDEKENQLKRTKSRELRGGIMYYSCHCIKRNGLQHDCRRTGCGGEPACLTLPDPLCAPSQLTRARGLADPAPLAAHLQAQNSGGGGGPADARAGSSSGKRFIVCELKGILPDIATDKTGKCCKCPATLPQSGIGGAVGGQIAHNFPTATQPHNDLTKCECLTKGFIRNTVQTPPPKEKKMCPCSSDINNSQAMFVFDEQTLKTIVQRFEGKEIADSGGAAGPGGYRRKQSNVVSKEVPCTRPGCIHWQPPPPCVWDAPCKADCFEAHPGIQPGRNPLTAGGLSRTGTMPTGGQGSSLPKDKMKLLTPNYCTGCCSAPHDGGGAGASSGGPAAGLPVMVMKLV